MPFLENLGDLLLFGGFVAIVCVPFAALGFAIYKGGQMENEHREKFDRELHRHLETITKAPKQPNLYDPVQLQRMSHEEFSKVWKTVSEEAMRRHPGARDTELWASRVD